MGLPPVVVGLFVSIFLWRSGPLGFLESPYANGNYHSPVNHCNSHRYGITLASLQQLPRKLKLQILALGASRSQMVWMLVKEAKLLPLPR